MVIAHRKRSAMAKCLKLILLAMVLAWTSAAPARSVEVGEMAPNFSLISLDGQILNLAKFRGHRPVLLYFWATWCYQCEKEWPKLLKIASGSGQRGVLVIGINVGVNDSARRVEAYRKKHGLTYPIVYDKESRFTRFYGVITVPTNFLIDRKGVVRYRGVRLPANLETLLGTSGQ
jgi:cytochrome c biogenesis protein CcmG/thiol:disulfide interchange protein DsbE